MTEMADVEVQDEVQDIETQGGEKVVLDYA